MPEYSDSRGSDKDEPRIEDIWIEWSQPILVHSRLVEQPLSLVSILQAIEVIPLTRSLHVTCRCELFWSLMVGQLNPGNQ